MTDKVEVKGDKVEQDDKAGEQKVSKEAAEGMKDLVSARREEMAQQKNTDRPPTTTSQKFGRLEISEGDQVVVKGHEPEAASKPTKEQIDAAAKGTIQDAAALVK